MEREKRGYKGFATLQSRIQRVESCVSLMSVDFSFSGTTKSSKWNKSTWRKKVLCLDLPFSPSVQSLLSSFGDFSLLTGVSIIHPREKYLPRVIVSLLFFYSISLVAAILRLVIID